MINYNFGGGRKFCARFSFSVHQVQRFSHGITDFGDQRFRGTRFVVT